jgi:hypothetical protein
MGTDTDARYAAVHLPGGNFFDDVRLDIERSHEALNTALIPSSKVYCRCGGPLMFYVDGVLQKGPLMEFLVTSGFRRGWFNDFKDYWIKVLGGRPLTVFDLLMLVHDYRKKGQRTGTLSWADGAEHVGNWQSPEQIYFTFTLARKHALQPVIGRRFWKHLRRGSKVLEYGAALAPFYNCYRNYFQHKACRWTLADLRTFPFHYAKYRYRHDAGVVFHDILPEDFSAPLREAGDFDAVIMTAVFEHLDDPLRVAEHVIDRIKPGGIMLFDYLESDGKGLDTPGALRDRRRCLERMAVRLEVLEGPALTSDDFLGTVICRKKC